MKTTLFIRHSSFSIMRHLTLLALVLFLAACAAEPPETSIGKAVPVAQQPAAAVPLATAAATATTTLTPTLAPTATSSPTATPSPSATVTPTPEHPLMIEVMRRRDYPGSPITIETVLEPGDNYDRYVASYISDGNKIYALLTVPRGLRPESGWPVIVFNHGYVPPDEYRTTERYVQYVDYFARSGYIVFRSDYRGHGDSEGQAGGVYSTPNYTIDVLNGLASIRAFAEADPARVGMWGHSMGGHITLRAMVVSGDVRAGVIWGGVVGPYPDLFNNEGAAATAVATYGAPALTATAESQAATRAPQSTAFAATRAALTTPAANGTPALPIFRNWRGGLFETYGSPEENPAFWASISANGYLADLSGPIQLHHAITDETVPAAASVLLYDQLLAAGQLAELYLYDLDSHDIDNNFYTAMRRSVEFFDRYVKGNPS